MVEWTYKILENQAISKTYLSDKRLVDEGGSVLKIAGSNP
jgi:hypothetical protein